MRVSGRVMVALKSRCLMKAAMLLTRSATRIRGGWCETCRSNVRICACMKITGSYGPILVMIVAAGFFVAGVGCSLALIIRELRKAPEGYEDEHGFHTVRNGAVKYGVPDSMKARRTRSSLNWAMHRTLRIKAFRVRGLPFFGKRVPHAASEFSATSRRRAGSCR